MKKSFLSQIWLGSNKNDLLLSAIASISWASIIGMYSLAPQSKNLMLLVNISYIIFNRGFLLTGWIFNLKGLRRGARMLIFVGFYRLIFGYEAGSIIASLSDFIEIIGVITLFVDMLPLKLYFNKYIIFGVVSLKIIALFLLKLEWLPYNQSHFLSAFGGCIVAYLFWEISKTQISELKTNN
jgi:hypothetical protein